MLWFRWKLRDDLPRGTSPEVQVQVHLRSRFEEVTETVELERIRFQVAVHYLLLEQHT